MFGLALAPITVRSFRLGTQPCTLCLCTLTHPLMVSSFRFSTLTLHLRSTLTKSLVLRSFCLLALTLSLHHPSSVLCLRLPLCLLQLHNPRSSRCLHGLGCFHNNICLFPPTRYLCLS